MCWLAICQSFSFDGFLVPQDHADYIDLNLGCPQRIAKRGYYGAFLMDNLGLVKQLVTAAATQLKTPVSVKIRLFPELQTTIDYALMLQQAGASLLAVHGRTRDMKVCCAPRPETHANNPRPLRCLVSKIWKGKHAMSYLFGPDGSIAGTLSAPLVC